MTYEGASNVPTDMTGDLPAGRIAVRAANGETEWRALMAAAPFGHLPQDFSFSIGKDASGWPSRRLVFSSGDQPVAFAVVLEFRRFGMRLFNRINRGPILLEKSPSDERVLEVYRAVRNAVGRLRTSPLLIAPALLKTDHNIQLLRKAGYIRRNVDSWRSGRIDISVSEEELWKSFGSTFRNRTRNAQKLGAKLRIADDAATYEWMIARHIENMEAKHFSAAKPELLRGMREAAPGNLLIFQLLMDAEPVAGMSVVRFGRIAEYHVGWFGPDGRKVNAGNFLTWNVMREMRRRGVQTFDVGGLRLGDGYTHFKRTMKPVEYELAGEWIGI